MKLPLFIQEVCSSMWLLLCIVVNAIHELYYPLQSRAIRLILWSISLGCLTFSYVDFTTIDRINWKELDYYRPLINLEKYSFFIKQLSIALRTTTHF